MANYRFVRFSEHVRQNRPLRTVLEMAFRASRFQHVLGKKNPDPSSLPNWRLCDSARRWQLNRGFIYNLLFSSVIFGTLITGHSTEDEVNKRSEKFFSCDHASHSHYHSV